MTGDGLGDFEALYERLRRFAFVVGSLDMDADDLVQEALTRTLSRHRFADLDDPGRYLRTVIVRLAANGRRQAGRDTQASTGAPRSGRRNAADLPVRPCRT